MMPFKREDFWNFCFLLFTAIGVWVSLKQLEKDLPKTNVFHEAKKEQRNAAFDAIAGLPYYLSYNVPASRDGENLMPSLVNADIDTVPPSTPITENNQ